MTRDDILHAAAQIFREKGFHATSMRDIANAVNLRKASLYHHVSSKQEILLDLLNRALDLLIEQLLEIDTLSLSPDQKLRRAIRSYVETLTSHRDLAAVLLLEFRSLRADLRSRHLSRRDQFEQLWRSMIQSGMDQGVFTSADPSIATKALLGSMNWTITWFRPNGSLSASQIADMYADLFLSGLRSRPLNSQEEER